MKVLFALSALLFSTSILASQNTYQVNLDYSIDGQPSGKMTVTVEEGKLASAEVNSEKGQTFFDVIATEHKYKGKRAIHLEFNVGYLQRDGSRKIISRPKTVTLSGQEASITVGQEDNPEMQLKVTAIRR